MWNFHSRFPSFQAQRLLNIRKGTTALWKGELGLLDLEFALGSTDQTHPLLPAQHGHQPGEAMGFHESVSWRKVFPFATLLLPQRFTLPSPES